MLYRSLQTSSLPVISSGGKNIGSGLIFDTKNTVLDNVPTSLGSWGNGRLNKQVCCAISNFLAKMHLFSARKNAILSVLYTHTHTHTYLLSSCYILGSPSVIYDRFFELLNGFESSNFQFLEQPCSQLVQLLFEACSVDGWVVINCLKWCRFYFHLRYAGENFLDPYAVS